MASEPDVGVASVLKSSQFADARGDHLDALQQVALRDRRVLCGVTARFERDVPVEQVPEVVGEVRVGVEARDGLPAVEDDRDRLHLDCLVGQQVADFGDDDRDLLGRRNVEDCLHARGVARRGERGYGGRRHPRE